MTLIERADKSACEIMGVEIAQVVKALAHADLDDGQLKLVADGTRDAALGRADELRDDERRPFWPVVASMTSTV